MNKNNINIRLEKQEEYKEVENLVRESFVITVFQKARMLLSSCARN